MSFFAIFANKLHRLCFIERTLVGRYCGRLCRDSDAPCHTRHSQFVSANLNFVQSEKGKHVRASRQVTTS